MTQEVSRIRPNIDPDLPKATIKVRGYHLDLYGHVNNARYLELLEEGRWAAFDGRASFEEWEQKGLAFFVVNININYRAPAALGQVLEIRTVLDHLSEHSATLRQEVVEPSHDLLVADATVTFVLVDAITQHAVPMAGDVRDEIERIFHRNYGS